MGRLGATDGVLRRARAVNSVPTQPPQQLAEVAACRGQQGIDGVAGQSSQKATSQTVVGLEMPDLRLNRTPASAMNAERSGQSTVATASDVNGRGSLIIMPPVGDVLLLHGGVDIHLPQFLRRDDPFAQGQRVRLLQQFGQPLRTHPLTPFH